MINRSIKRVEKTLLRKVLAVIRDVKSHIPDTWDIRIFETERSQIRQQDLYDHGFSLTMNSKHLLDNKNICHAVDIVFINNKSWTWNSPYWYLVESSKKAHGIRNINSSKFVDIPHCELLPN